MASRPDASRLRQRFHALAQERHRLEEERLLPPQRPMRGSLLARHLGPVGSQRASVAHYLSRLEGGRPKHRYVSVAHLAAVRTGVEAWKSYRQAISRWRAISRELARLLPQLLNAQEVDPPS